MEFYKFNKLILIGPHIPILPDWENSDEAAILAASTVDWGRIDAELDLISRKVGGKIPDLNHLRGLFR